MRSDFRTVNSDMSDGYIMQSMRFLRILI